MMHNDKTKLFTLSVHYQYTHFTTMYQPLIVEQLKTDE